MSQKQKKKKESIKKKTVVSQSFDYAKAILFAVVAAFIIKTSIAEAYKVPSSSMEDTLLVGDLIISNKFLYGVKIPFTNWRLPAVRPPQPGDIITFKYPLDGKTDYVKRCVAVEGQIVEVKNKILYVDGEIFPDAEFSKYIDGKNPDRFVPQRDNFGPYRVPQGSVFAMGDNRDNSRDSRFWGIVPLEFIEGYVFMIQWSIAEDKDATQIDMTDLTTIPGSVWDNTTRFLGRIRWDRFAKTVD
ncbi:MAG: signal peptidase I [Candidatus Zixiibacteriota bacterium]